MILGIDTSCYTTSVALCDEQGRLLCDKRRLLPVEQGQCGLRQSDAVFCHVRQLPQLVEEAFLAVPGQKLQAVAVSCSPRPKQDSYMPVFMTGLAVARSIAASHGVPCFTTSHQEGHIMAALVSAGLFWQEPFLVLHLSGGTGEILLVKPHATGFFEEIVGDTDLPPGQFVDRVGVALGLPFPAGPALEKLAQRSTDTSFRLSGSVKGTHISFSGPETAARRAISQGIPGEDVAAAVFDNIAKSLSKAITNAREQYGCRKVILAGGVAANRRIRERLKNMNVHFAKPEYCGDNATGVAALGWKMWCQQEK